MDPVRDAAGARLLVRMLPHSLLCPRVPGHRAQVPQMQGSPGHLPPTVSWNLGQPPPPDQDFSTADISRDDDIDDTTFVESKSQVAVAILSFIALVRKTILRDGAFHVMSPDSGTSNPFVPSSFLSFLSSSQLDLPRDSKQTAVHCSCALVIMGASRRTIGEKGSGSALRFYRTLTCNCPVEREIGAHILRGTETPDYSILLSSFPIQDLSFTLSSHSRKRIPAMSHNVPESDGTPKKREEETNNASNKLRDDSWKPNHY